MINGKSSPYTANENRCIKARVHNISREEECLTAYTCFKCATSSTESTPPGVN